MFCSWLGCGCEFSGVHFQHFLPFPPTPKCQPIICLSCQKYIFPISWLDFVFNSADELELTPASGNVLRSSFGCKWLRILCKPFLNFPDFSMSRGHTAALLWIRIRPVVESLHFIARFHFIFGVRFFWLAWPIFLVSDFFAWVGPFSGCCGSAIRKAPHCSTAPTTHLLSLSLQFIPNFFFPVS